MLVRMMPAAQTPAARIREARQRDAEALAQLSGQLGYAATAEEIRERLKRIARDPRTTVLVAEGEAGTLIGWMQLIEQHVLETGGRVEMAGLVVDAAFRRRGVGHQLMERGEQWARQRGLHTVNLRSNVTRAAAHTFYEQLGYRHLKTQKAFSKQI